MRSIGIYEGGSFSVRPRFRIGYASRFCGKPQKFGKLRMTRAGFAENSNLVGRVSMFAKQT
jgi:hypothetical protein